jgi:glycosyltransferase involved in cell wall biosynthesis
MAYLTKLRKECDVVIDEINVLPFFTPLYVRKPKIVIQHQTIKEVFFIQLPPPLAIFGYFIERIYPLFYSFTKFITVSPSTKKDLVELGIPKKNIAIVYNGLDKKKFKTGMKSNYPHVIYLGRLEKAKRVDLLINSMFSIIKEIPNARLSIVGTGKYEDKLKQLVKKIGLEKYVKFYGYVTERKKIKLIQDAWVLVSPSIREGWGLSVLEANACGTPAVAFNVPGLRDSIKNGKTGLLVSNMNSLDLARFVLRIIKNKKLMDELRENAIKWSKNFDWSVTAVKILSILKKTVNE